MAHRAQTKALIAWVTVTNMFLPEWVGIESSLTRKVNKQMAQENKYKEAMFFLPKMPNTSSEIQWHWIVVGIPGTVAYNEGSIL